MNKTGSAKLTMVGLLLAVGMAGGFSQGYAGTIEDGVSFGAGVVSGSIVSPSPNNDNTTSASPNVVDLTKTFNSVGAIDIQFGVLNSGAAAPGITEYFFSETVTNNTGVAWTDYHFVLGFGTLETIFAMSGLEDLLDFDTCASLGCVAQDPTPTSSVFTVLTHGINELSWVGGSVPNGGSVTFTFSIDVPDSASCSGATPACPLTDGGYLFTLRQFPTTDETPRVPLPGSLVLLGSGALALGVAARRRQRTGA